MNVNEQFLFVYFVVFSWPLTQIIYQILPLTLMVKLTWPTGSTHAKLLSLIYNFFNEKDSNRIDQSNFLIIFISSIFLIECVVSLVKLKVVI